MMSFTCEPWLSVEREATVIEDLIHLVTFPGTLKHSHKLMEAENVVCIVYFQIIKSTQ